MLYSHTVTNCIIFTNVLKNIEWRRLYSGCFHISINAKSKTTQSHSDNLGSFNDSFQSKQLLRKVSKLGSPPPLPNLTNYVFIATFNEPI